jgi:hypothetical protein
MTYDPNEHIVFEGTDNYKIFWIVKGTCHCIKRVPFVKRTTNANYAGKTIKILPRTPDMILEPNDEPFDEMLNIYELDVGNNFPELPAPTGTKSIDEKIMYVNRKEYTEQIQGEDPRDANLKSNVSIVAKTKVEVAAITRLDYAKFAGNEMLLEVINSRQIFRVPMSQLQDSYLEKRNWEVHKKKVVASIAVKK